MAHVVVFAIVVAAIYASAGAASPYLITILGTTFTIVNAGAVVGAGLGFVVGLGLAIDNTCLDFTNGFQDSAYTSCD